MSSQIESLMEILDRDVLEQLAGERSFDRGEEYQLSGRVKSLTADDGMVVAKVTGSETYRVQIWEEDGEIEYSCTCPVNDSGAFCKHCVAVGLELLARGTEFLETKQAAVTMDDVRSYLRGLEKDALVEMVVERAKADDEFRDRLLMKAAKQTGTGIELSAYRDALRNAIDVDDYVEYRDMHSYTRGIRNVVASVEELMEEGYASEVVELAESALDMMEAAIPMVDDSSGDMGEILGSLQQIHLAACEQARPDPGGLARRLFEWELRSDYDTFCGAVEEYADVLGEDGLAVYRQLVEAEWAKVGTLSPGQDDPERYGRRYRITSMMRGLASESGDVEAQVAVMSRDLSVAYRFLEIANLYKSNGRPDKALEWAEKGLAAFPKRTDDRLRDFLADEYHRRGRHDEAIALIWARFSELSTLQHYKELKAHADRANQWPAWRAKAIQLLRDDIAGKKLGNAREPWRWRTDASELIRIHLWEKDTEAAWEEAKRSGCDGPLWLDLAATREKDHPEDALAIYRPIIEPAIESSDYERAAGFLGKVMKLMIALGREQEFDSYLQQIRTTYKRRKNLMKLLDSAKWAQ